MMKLPSRIAVLGASVSGENIVEYLLSQGVEEILLCDNKAEPLYQPDHPKVKCQYGEHWLEGVENYDMVFRSPGIAPFAEELEKLPKEKLMTATKWFFKHCPAQITGITGSNGKTTTTALVYELLRRKYGDRLVRGGNDAKPLLDLLETLTEQDQVLLEMSSFQLYDLGQSPHIAALLNITPNHLDWHEDMSCYSTAKKQIFLHQTNDDVIILNNDDLIVSDFRNDTSGRCILVGTEGDLTIQEGNIHIGSEIFMPLAEVACKTHPNNLLAAIAIALEHEIDHETIRSVLQEFSGVTHRLEFIREVEGRKFYNDSACTTPDAALVAIKNFEAEEMILMLGGADKGMDFSSLIAKIVAQNIRVYPYGAMGEFFQKAISEAGGEGLILSESISSNFPKILRDVLERSQKGDQVVFSPACTSFDMFSNAKERGKEFTRLVNEL